MHWTSGPLTVAGGYGYPGRALEHLYQRLNPRPRAHRPGGAAAALAAG